MGSWLRALLAEPFKEYPQFEAALSLLPALPPKEVQLLLAERLGRLEEQERQMQADINDAAAANMPALFLVESEYALALVRAERGYVKGLAQGIETGELGGVEQWQQWHLDHKHN
jgi:flagellar biosynthesis/type III secretory pathway protein FliH